MVKTSAIVLLSACVIALGVVAGVSLTHRNPANPEVVVLKRDVKTMDGTISTLKATIKSLETSEQNATAQVAQAEATAKAASSARLGVCYSYTSSSVSASGNLSPGMLFMGPPIISHGVYECPNGETFTSVVPSTAGS